jgi:hypothetical protein
MDSPRQLKRLRRNNAGAQSDSSEDEIEQVQLMDTNSEQDSEEVSGGETQQDAVKHNVHSKTKCWLFFTVPQKGMKQNLSNLSLKCMHVHWGGQVYLEKIISLTQVFQNLPATSVKSHTRAWIAR